MYVSGNVTIMAELLQHVCKRRNREVVPQHRTGSLLALSKAQAGVTILPYFK